MNIKRIIGASALLTTFTLTGCSDDGVVEGDAGTESETSDTDDSDSGDGDGDDPATASGDGDGDDPTDDPTVGDGDGDDPTDDPSDDPTDESTAGDGDGDPTGDGDGDPMPDPGGRVRVMHGSPDAPPVDIYIEGVDDPVISGLAYAQTSGFLPVPEGEYNFQVYVAGAEPIADNLVIETGAVMIGLDTDYTVLARGLLAPEMGEGEFGLELYVDGFEAVAPGTVRARLVHAGADAPTVDLDVYDANAEAPCSGPREIPDFARFTDTGELGVELPAVDGINVAVCAGNVAARTFTLDIAALDGAELYVFADGLLAQNVGRAFDAFQLLAIGPDTAGDAISIRRDPLFYLLHAVPDVGEVNVCLEGAGLQLGGVPFTGFAGEVSLPPNVTREFFLDPVGMGPPCGDNIPFPIDGSSLTRGDTHVVVVAGSVGLDNLSQQIYTDGTALDDPDNLRVQAVHMSPDTPEVDVGAEGAGFGVWTDLAYPDASDPEGVSLPPDTYTIQAGVSMAQGEDADAAAVSFGPLNLEGAAGARVMAFVGGLLAPGFNGSPLTLMLVGPTDQGDYGWSLTAVPAN